MDQQLTSKLGHSLEEVRTRAWAAVAFKLSTGVLTIADLVHQTEFLCHLLNWFNQDAPGQPTKLEDMLKFTLSIAKHPSGKHKLNSIGGISFLKSLRNSLDRTPECQRGIDDILDSLLHSPNHCERANEIIVQQPHSCRPILTKGAAGRAPATVPKHFWTSQSPEAVFRPESRPRSRSPDRRLKSMSPIKAPQIVPPYLPNAISTYAILHLSPYDESLVSHFCTLMSGSLNDSSQENRLFNILRIDFGAQIFLQRSQLFRAVMNGVFADIDGRSERSWIYLEDLVQDWAKSFRRFTDTVLSSLSPTPMNATPNVSMNLGIMADARAAMSDYAVSLPFASHEIYLRLVPLLRDPQSMPRALRILNGILPFLRIHIDVILAKGWGGLDTPPPSAVVAHYISFAAEVIGYHGLHSEVSVDSPDEVGQSRLLMQERTIAFCFDVVSALAPSDLGERNQLLWICILQIFDLPGTNPFPATIIRRLVAHDVPLLHVLSCLLTYPQMWVRLASYEVLAEMGEGTLRMLNVSDGQVFILIAERGLRDESGQIQQLAYNIIIDYIGNNPNHELLKRALPVIQAFADLDGGHLLQSTLGLLQNDLTPHDRLVIGIRGLLHSNEVCRKAAFESLQQTAPTLKDVLDSNTEGPNVFVISRGTIASFKFEQEYSSNETDLEGRLAALRSHGVHVSLKITVLKDLVTLLTSRTMISRAMQLGILRVIIQVMRDPGMNWIWEDENLLNALALTRTLVEADDQACDVIASEVDLLLSLTRQAFIGSESIRYELARIFFSASCCAQPYRSLGNTFGDIQSPGRSAPHRRLPQAIALNFMAYGSIFQIPDPFYDVFPNPLDEDAVKFLWPVIREYRQVASSAWRAENNQLMRVNPFDRVVSECCRRLHTALSHNEFRNALQILMNNCTCEADWMILSSQNLPAILGRFLMTAPANSDDAHVLSIIFTFLASMARLSSLPSSVFPTLKSSIRRVQLLVLERATRDDVTTAVDWRGLSSSVAGFLSWFLIVLPQNDLLELVANSSIMSVLVDYSTSVLLNKQKLSPVIHGDALTSLITITTIPSLTAVIADHVITNAIRLLVSYLSLVQQEGSDWQDEEIPRGNGLRCSGFTYCGRNAYQLAAMGLRNLSRAVVEARDTNRSWVWGDHWLIHDDIQWLMNLLNDDEKIVQKVGLGILGNIILVNGSYQYIVIKIPQFLDMAFAYALDCEKMESIRKEAFLVINHFLITFCLDNKLSGGSFGTSCYFDPVSAESGSNGNIRNMSAPRPITELLKIFDHCGFFDKLREVLSDVPRAAIAYKTAVTEVLLNLLLVTPSAMRSRISAQSGWPTIVDCLNPAHEARELDEDDESDVSSSYKLFRRRQFASIHGSSIDLLRCNVLQCIRLASYNDSETRRLLVSTTDVVAVVVAIIDERWNIIEPAGNKASCPETWSALRLSALVLSDLLWDACAYDKAGLETLLGGADTNRITIIGRLLLAGLGLLRRRSDCIMVAAGVQFLGRLLSMHCGENADIGVDVALKFECTPGAANAGILGPEICHEMMTIIIEEYDSSSPGHIESARIALQCLLGRSECAKLYALRVNFCEMLITRINLIRLANRIDDAHQMELYVLLCLLRHLFAGSVDAKQQALDHGANETFSELLSMSKEFEDSLLLELLCCIRNLVASCPEAKRAVVDPSKRKSGALSCVEGVVRVMKTLASNGQHDETFLACIEILKLLAYTTHTKSDTRTAIIKSTIVNDLFNLLNRLNRSKEMVRVEGILEFLYAMTLSREGQVYLMKVAGLFSLLVDLLSAKTVPVRRMNLLVLRNLLSLRENKAHALADENFIPTMLKYGLQSKSLALLAPATSCIWVFLYDSEKAKVALKKSTLKDDIVAVERRLIYEFAWFLQVEDPKDPTQWDTNFDRGDAENLVQTLQNISAIARLLSLTLQ
ncbi:hypothetical protein SeLEV6574_g07118 [Synchytrium endobioticum]|nr:hypothetical protein SeLEV6574_g07118 [Synchytrium endobioticum]